MTDYFLGTASSAAAANITQIQQQANLQQTQVFNQNVSGTRMLMFAFDGTGNSKDDPTFGNPSNVAHIYDSAKLGLTTSGSGDAFYYKGPGTGNLLNRVLDGATGMSVPAIVATAYEDLVRYANQNSGTQITIGTTGFSRGAASARAFMNAVWEQGIPDTTSKVSLGVDANTNVERFGFTRYLVEPQKADLGIAVLYDTVATGVARQPNLMRIPPAPGLKVFQLVAEDERRSLFASDSVVDLNNPNDPRITEWLIAGAHSDIGGTYFNNGIGLKTLDIGFNLFRNSGTPMANLPPSLQYGGQSLLIHDSFKGMYGPDAGPQTGGYVSEPRLDNARRYTNLPPVGSRTVVVFDDGSRIETITYTNGTTQILNRDGNWQLVRDTVTTRNSDGSVFQVSVTTSTGFGTTTKITDGQNILIRTENRQTFDDGSTLEITTGADGRETIRSQGIVVDGEFAGTLTDTPAADGSTTRVIDTITPDGQPVEITQQASAADLANGEQPGDYTTILVKINGVDAENATLIANVIDETYASAKDIILARGTGEFIHIVEAGDATNASGTTASLVQVTGRTDWWNAEDFLNTPELRAAVGPLNSLIAVLRGGTSLAIASNLVNLASHVFKDPAVAEIARDLGLLNNLNGIYTGLEKGDLGRVLINSVGPASKVLTIYSSALGQQLIEQFGSIAGARFAVDAGDELAGEVISKFDGASALLEFLGDATVVLSVINDVLNGDFKGAGITIIAYINPVLGAILTALDFAVSLIFDNKRDLEADGRFVVNAEGVISVESGNVNGGGQINFHHWMNAMLEMTQKNAATLSLGLPNDLYSNQTTLSIIAERLPVVTFKRDAMFLRYEDPLTKTVYYKTFDFDGKYLSPGSVEDILHAGQTTIFRSPWGDAPENPFVNRGAHPRDQQPGNQVAQSDNFFDSFATQYSDAVIKSGAIAPMWEVWTSLIQKRTGEHYFGYQYAGYTTEQIALQSGTNHNYSFSSPGDARLGNRTTSGQPLNEASQQTATVIALDLNNDGIITVTKKATGNGVLFDVDNDGFAEETDWIGPRDGILVLDRTSSGEVADGQINRGADLFNDTWVDGSKRMLSVLNEIDDAFYQQGINIIGGGEVLDPVFDHLKVWQDINGDGVAQAAELQGLRSMGIHSLNWDAVNASAIGSFSRGFNTGLMQSVNLQADASGVATVQVGNSLLVQREVGDMNESLRSEYWGHRLYATAVIDYGASTDAAVRAAHTHTSANGILTVTDEVLEGKEDTAITVSVAQLLKNDRSTGGAVSFAGVPSDMHPYIRDDVGGHAIYEMGTETVTFIPNDNFNGVASFVYKVQDGQGNIEKATAYIDIGAVDDAPTIEITGARRQASWKDLNLTLNAQGAMVYGLQAAVDNAIGQAPADPAVQVVSMGYLGVSGTALLPDSVGIIGAAAGKLYFAAFGQAGNPATQGPWVEVWVDTIGNPSKGMIGVYDVDNQSVISIGIASRGKDQPLDGQFGDSKVVDNQNGTANFDYTRTSLWSEAPRTYLSGGNSSMDGTPVYVPAKIGPDDAFMLEIKQAGATPEETITTYKKVIVGGGDVSQLRSEDEYLNLVDGIFQPPANPEPFNAFPIVLDLNDNGFRFIAKDDSSAFYDLAGDGVRRATAWTSGQDALLAYDANNDGKISGKGEISFKDYLPGAATDLAGLAAFDTNADGVFSSADAQWGKFRVWQDKNEDGIQTADELSNLTERGIASINLTSNNVAASASGVTVHGVGSYTRIDGTEAQLADAQFAYTSETLASVKDDTVDLNVNPVAQLNTGGGDDAITGSANADKINAGTGHDFVTAGGGDDLVIGGAGNDQIGGGDGADTLWGGKGADKLAGDAGHDLLYGGSGDDYLGGGDGDDQLWGGTGNDVTSGGAGLDTYHFALGDGNDLIRDTDGLRIVLGINSRGQSINPQNIQAEALEGGRGYILRFSATDSLTVQNMSIAPFTVNTVQITLADGSSVSMAQLLAATHTNHRPTLASAVADQSANKGSLWTYTVPAGTFADVDAGDTLSLAATLANGDALPLWLSFNAATRSFSGTPPASGLSNLDIRVTATDAFGLDVTSSFNLAVQAAVNRTPTVANALTEQTTNEDSAWTFTVPANTFADPDVGDTLSLQATLANGDPLPAWLSFNAATRTFSGTPLNANVGTLAIKVVAADALGLSASSTFDVQVANTNDAPMVANALTQITVNEDTAWTFTVPANTFADPDVGDTLSLQATLANGDALPSWLSFNAATRTFSGTPLNANVGTLAIKVVAADALGLFTSSTFDVQVANTNDAPTVGTALVNQTTFSGQVFSYALPMTGVSAAFADQDVGDVLTLSAKLVNGDALPGWLSFNAVTGTFSGTPSSTSVGSLGLQVAATDVAGASVSSAVALAVQAAVVTDGTTPPPGALVGTPGKDVLTATSIYTEVWGLAGDDIINGFLGNTRLVGGAGNDTINAVGGSANVLDGGDGNDVLTGALGMDTLIGGQGNNTIRVMGGAALVTAGSGNDLITALWGDDRIDAGGGNNDIKAGGGNNNLLVGPGNDDISADAGNDTINAGDGNNAVSAGEGRNLIVSGEGNDMIAARGVNVVIAGAGNDKITLGSGNDWVQAGKGNDQIDAGGGANLLAFNKGDGADTVVNSVGGADTISLGGGIKYADLTLAKAGDDLVLKGAGGDRITLKDWYQANQNQGVGKLQVLTAGGDFDATSTSTLVNKTVTVFDFDKLVKAFDIARLATPNAASGWAVSSSLSAAQLHATAPIATGYVNPWAALQAGTALLEKAPTAAINPISTSTAQSIDQLLFAALNATGNSNRAAGWMQA